MMMRRCKSRSRRGAVLVEAAVVYPVFLLFLLGILVLGLGVFRYGQLAALSWEGARWASVRGTDYQNYGPDYQQDRKLAKPTNGDVAANIDLKMLFGFKVEQSGLASTLDPDLTTVTLGYDWKPEYNPTVDGQDNDGMTEPPKRLFDPIIRLNGSAKVPTLYFRTD